MAALRTITLKWDIHSGRVKCSSCYVKRSERVDVELYITDDGEDYALPDGWAIVQTLKGQNASDGDALVQITDFSAGSDAGHYTATAQAISSTALDTYLNINADANDDVESQFVDLDIYYTISEVVQAASDTIVVTLKPNIGRTLDDTPVPPSYLDSLDERQLFYVAATYAGDAQPDAEFGFLQATRDIVILGADVCCRTGAIAEDLTMALLLNGSDANRVLTVTGSETGQQTLFTNGLNLVEGDVLTLQFGTVGTTPASFVHVNLICRPGAVAVSDDVDGALLTQGGDFLMTQSGDNLAFN